MLSRWIRSWYGNILSPPLLVFEKLGIRPNTLTIGGLLAHAIAGALFASGQMAWGTGAIVLGQSLDTLDGELARRGTASPFGAFLDSICDHLGDLAVYLGLLWHVLTMNGRTEVVLIVVALFGSVFGSQVRSRAGMLGIDTKAIGIFTRFERTLVLIVGILVNQLTIALWILAVFNNLSALQRIVYAVRASQRDHRGHPG